MARRALAALAQGIFNRVLVRAGESRWISNAIYVLVALIWLVPDRRIENVTKH